ncbi:MAG: hypothetical protein ACKO28_04265 [Cyanobium sp.]
MLWVGFQSPRHQEWDSAIAHRHPVGLERGLDPFAQQRLGERTDATGAVEPAKLGH